jgi:hypothetical protein
MVAGPQIGGQLSRTSGACRSAGWIREKDKANLRPLVGSTTLKIIKASLPNRAKMQKLLFFLVSLT